MSTHSTGSSGPLVNMSACTEFTTAHHVLVLVSLWCRYGMVY